MPVALYIVAMIGFSAAGLGILGLGPVVRFIGPLLVVSSVWSLVGLFRLGHGDLTAGAVIDVALILAAFAGSWSGWWQRRVPVHRMAAKAAAVCGVLFLGYVVAAALSWPIHRQWGSTLAERQVALPGDAANRTPAVEIQHAVTIDAPPDRVWPWLVQLGQDRAGFYSYDWLERAVGDDIRNVFELRPEWQDRRVGDVVPATQEGYLGGIFGNRPGWRVAQVEPRRALVLDGWGAFVLMPSDPGRTRFIIRSRAGGPGIPVWAAGLQFMAFELPHFIMERRMMLTIKALAEGREQRAAAGGRAAPLARRAIDLLIAPVEASAQQPTQSPSGSYLFRTYCASCHGSAARGDGPLADSMRRRPPDLTQIATRNKDVFPGDLVFQIIDGRQKVRGHGGPDMPVWGDAFARSAEGGGEDAVRARIRDLVKFLEGIQMKSGE
jgi:mono/diheme cytochrome c family protein